MFLNCWIFTLSNNWFSTSLMAECSIFLSIEISKFRISNIRIYKSFVARMSNPSMWIFKFSNYEIFTFQIFKTIQIPRLDKLTNFQRQISLFSSNFQILVLYTRSNFLISTFSNFQLVSILFQFSKVSTFQIETFEPSNYQDWIISNHTIINIST